MPNPTILAELPKYTREAVRFYWLTRSQQLEKQRQAGGSDQGLRSAVTGGAQMNGFIELLTKLVIETGIDRAHIFYEQSLELPGYFRPDKKWDFIVVVNGQLVAALEAKSQVGPSFAEDFRKPRIRANWSGTRFVGGVSQSGIRRSPVGRSFVPSRKPGFRPRSTLRGAVPAAFSGTLLRQCCVACICRSARGT